MSLKSEILEQPKVLAHLLEGQMDTAREIARAVKGRGVEYVFLVARGTSDNAGVYGKYLWGAVNGLPVALAAPSLFSIYGTPPVVKNALVVGISQSGQSPDIVSVLEQGRQQGALSLAITNAADSPLAKAADWVLDVSAGEEKAVAATKTYTAQLMAIAMLSAALSGDAAQAQVLSGEPALVEEVLSLDGRIEEVAERYRYMSQCVVLGRGYNYATAFEWSLKLKELAYVVAEPYSSADFRHGPIAIVERGFPVLAAAPRGAVLPDMLNLLSRLVNDRKAELIALSDDDEVLGLARTALRLPAGMAEWISPLVTIVPAQLFCYHLTRAKGWDTEKPRGLHKVTETR